MQHHRLAAKERVNLGTEGWAFVQREGEIDSGGARTETDRYQQGLAACREGSLAVVFPRAVRAPRGGADSVSGGARSIEANMRDAEAWVTEIQANVVRMEAKIAKKEAAWDSEKA